MKKIVTISAIVSMIAGGIFIGDFLLKLGIFNFLIKPAVRDVFLFLLIIGILIWTTSINKKTKKPASKEIGELRAPVNNMKRYNDKLRETVNKILSINRELGSSVEKVINENKQLRDENKKINDLIEKKISETKREMRRDLEERLEKIKTEPQQKKEVLKPNREIIFILNLLATQYDRTLKQATLWSMYKSTFKEKEESDFQIVLNELDTADLIFETECGDFGEICYKITTIGLKYLKQNKPT